MTWVFHTKNEVEAWEGAVLYSRCEGPGEPGEPSLVKDVEVGALGYYVFTTRARKDVGHLPSASLTCVLLITARVGHLVGGRKHTWPYY